MNADRMIFDGNFEQKNALIILDKEEYDKEINNLISEEYKKCVEPLSFPNFYGFPDPKASKQNYEYVLKMVKPSPEKLESLLAQMKFRLQDGNGEAFYELGIEENGNPLGLCQEDMHDSLKTLYELASRLKSEVNVLNFSNGLKGKTAEVMIRQNKREGIKIEIRMAVMGQHGSGKSTLIGVLTSGCYDNGLGLARLQSYNHKEEFSKGKTSSITYHIIGFDSQGNIINKNTETQSWAEIIDKSTKVLQLIDLGEKIVYDGVCSLYPEYILLTVSIKKEINKNIEEYIKISVAINVPLIIAVSHVDLSDQIEIDDFTIDLKKKIKMSCDSIPFFIKNEKDVVLLSKLLQKEKIIPIFFISNVSGEQIELFKTFLNLLPIVNLFQRNTDLYTEVFIHDKYEVQGSIVLAGTVIKGSLKKYQILHLGPDIKGKFYPVEILEIYCSKVPIKKVIAGQTCSVSIKLGKSALAWFESNKKETVRRGMVLIEGKSNPKAAYEFLAEIILWDQNSGETKLKNSYQPVINTQTTRQSCKIIQDKYFSIDDNSEKLSQFKEIKLTKKISKSIDNKKNLYENSKNNCFVEGKSQNYQLRKKTFAHSFQLNEKDFDKKNKEECYFENQKTKEMKKNMKKLFPKITISPNKKNLLRFRFMYFPEYILVGQKLLINDSSLKAIGWVKEIFY